MPDDKTTPIEDTKPAPVVKDQPVTKPDPIAKPIVAPKPAEPEENARPAATSVVALTPGTTQEVLFTVGDVLVGRMFATLPFSGPENSNRDEWDTGVFEIKDANVVVAYLWVQKVSPTSKTERWGLSTGYQWPGSANPLKTFTYTLSTVSFATETDFKNYCNTKFSNTVVTYLKSTPVSF